MVKGFDEDDAWSACVAMNKHAKKREKSRKKLEIQLESHNPLNNADM